MVADTEADLGVGEPLDSSQTGHLVFCDRELSEKLIVLKLAYS